MARRAVGRRLLDLLAPAVLRAVAASWRVERVGAEAFEALHAAGAYVAAMWHGAMLAPTPLHRHRGIAVLVSPSDDGGLVVKVLRRFGYGVIRGSTSRHGPRAMREMREALAAGTPVVVTPDGPRGPQYAMNVGVAWLARETGAPILPVRITAAPAWRLRSWDKFMIPKPFAKVRVEYLPAVRVPRDATDLELEALSATLRQAMLPDGPGTA